jgi:hypothetical protein
VKSIGAKRGEIEENSGVMKINGNETWLIIYCENKYQWRHQ